MYRYRRELEDFIIENNVNFTTESEIDDFMTTFENQELDSIEKGIVNNMNRCLKTAAYAYRFYSEYSQNPMVKIENYMLEQKK